jgi:hypothetical protein
MGCINITLSDEKLTAILAVIISIFSALVSTKAYRNLIRNEFIKKQIDAVTSVIDIIHNSPFQFNLTTYSTDGGSGAEGYKFTIFELTEINRLHDEIRNRFFEAPIFFHPSCNQLVKIKALIDNPLLPKSIADELENFYSRLPSGRVTIQDVVNGPIIVINSDVFEENIFEKLDAGAPLLRKPNAFAFNSSVQNLIACSESLESSIRNWFIKYKVDEINIRRDRKTI